MLLLWCLPCARIPALSALSALMIFLSDWVACPHWPPSCHQWAGVACSVLCCHVRALVPVACPPHQHVLQRGLSIHGWLGFGPTM